MILSIFSITTFTLLHVGSGRKVRASRRRGR
jgi:hypothetical protein